LDFLAENTNPSGQANGNLFTFGSIDLTVKQFENIRITVDGVEISPEDDPVDALDDQFSTGENSVLIGSVLGNDSVPDIVASVALDGPAPEGLTLSNYGTFEFDPGSNYDYLAVGESLEVPFNYVVTDADGDSDTATVAITVTGENDTPEAVDDQYQLESADILNVSAAAGLLSNDSDIDTSDQLLVSHINGAAVSSGEVVTLNSGALLTICEDGSFSYDSNGAFGESILFEDSFEYEDSPSNHDWVIVGGNNNVFTSTDESSEGNRSARFEHNDGVHSYAYQYFDEEPLVDGMTISVDFFDEMLMGGNWDAGSAVKFDGGGKSAGISWYNPSTYLLSIYDGPPTAEIASSVERSYGWHEFRYVVDGDYIDLYIDDTQVADDIFEASTLSFLFLFIGTEQPLTGYFDNVRVTAPIEIPESDSFEYTVSDGNGGFDTASATLYADDFVF